MDSKSSVNADLDYPEQYYAVPESEWTRTLKGHIKLGHSDHIMRSFAALRERVRVEVPRYLPNADKAEYYEQDNWGNFPANRVVFPDLVKVGP